MSEKGEINQEIEDAEFNEACPINNPKFTGKRLCGLFLLFVVYVFLGSLCFILIEECNDINTVELVENTTKPNLERKNVNVKKNVTSTLSLHLPQLCQEVGVLLNTNTTKREWQFKSLLAACAIMVRTENISSANNSNNNTGLTHPKKCDVLDTFFQAKWQTYCTISILTIGYGNTTPKTDNGKLLTIFYTMFGIPLALMWLAEICKNVLSVVVYTQRGISYLFQCQHHYYMHLRVCISVIFVLVCALVLGAFIRVLKDPELTMLDSIYFSYITITTIGYGDYYVELSYLSKSDDLLMFFVETINFTIGVAMLGSLLNIAPTLVAGRYCCKK